MKKVFLAVIDHRRHFAEIWVYDRHEPAQPFARETLVGKVFLSIVVSFRCLRKRGKANNSCE